MSSRTGSRAEAVMRPDSVVDFRRYINGLFVCLPVILTFFIPYTFLLICFLKVLIYFLTYPSPSSRIGPSRFQARGHRRRPNLAKSW